MAESERGGDSRQLMAQLVPFLLARGYGPNERAPSERQLAERFNTSRTQMRETLSVLEALRVIERRPKSGIYMTAEATSLEALALFAQVGIPLSKDEVGEIVEVKRIQELQAVRLACERHTEENVAALRACLGDTEVEIAAGRPIARQDRRFHCEIARATQNGVFYRLVDVFYYMTEKRREYFFGERARCEQSHAEHVEIFHALVARDAERAVDLLERHLQGADSYWRGLLDAGE